VPGHGGTVYLGASPGATGLVTLLGRTLQVPARTDGEGRFRLDHVAPGIHTPLVPPSDGAVGTPRRIPVETPCEVEVAEGGESFVDVRVKE